MQIQKVKLSLLQASAQPRPLITADVDKLAASIREVGLISPITVRAALITGNITKDGFRVVAGHHRVAAVRALGWDEIDAIVMQDGTRLQAELIEIDENLVRSELTSAQRGHYTARRAEIREALCPTPTPDAYALESYDGDDGETESEESGKTFSTLPKPKTGRGNTQFAAETAAITGQSKQSINQHRARGDALGPDILRVVGTSLDKGVELDALAKMDKPQRTALIERAEAGEKVSARPAPPPAPAPPVPPVVRESQTTAPAPPAQSGPANGLALVKCLDVMLSELLKRTGYDEVAELAQALSLIRDLDAANAELLGQCLNEFAQVGRCSTAPALS